MHVSSEPNTKARVNLNVDLINNTVSYLKVEQLVHVLHNRFVQFQKRINAPVGGPLPSAMGEIQPSSSLVVTGSASAHASPPSRAAICDSIVAKPPRERNYWDERELYVAAEELCCYLNGGVNYRILCAQYQDTLEAVRGMIQEDLQLSPSVEVVPTGTLERLMAQFEKAMRLCVRNFEEHGLPVPNALTELLAQHAGKPSSTPGDGKSSEAVDDASGGKASPSGIQTTQNSGQHFTHTTASANTSNIAFLDISSPRSPEGDRSIKKTPSGRSLSASSRSGLNFVEAGYPDERRSPNQNQLLSSRLSRARGPNDVLAHLPRQPQTNFVDDNASNRQRVYNRAASRHATNTSRSDCLSPTAHTPLSGELPNDAASPLMRSKVSSEGSGTYGGKPLRGNESAALRMGLPLPNTPPKRELSPPMSNNVSVERTKPQADLFLPSATDASMDVTLPPSVAFPNGPQPRRQRQLEELYNEAYHEDGQRFLLDALHIVYAYNYQASKGSFPSFRSQVQSDLRSALASREHFEETVGVPQLRSEYLIECLARMVKPHPQVLELLQSLDMQRGHARCEGGLSGIDVEALSLSGLQLGDSGAAALITLFPRLCRLTSVDLSDNNLHDGAVIRVLCATLRCHPSISRVVLSNNNVSEASVLELRRLVQSCRRRCTIELHGCPMPLALKQAINGKLS